MVLTVITNTYQSYDITYLNKMNFPLISTPKHFGNNSQICFTIELIEMIKTIVMFQQVKRFAMYSNLLTVILLR